MNDVFLGEPPARIKQWIIEYYGPHPGPGKKTQLIYSDGVVLESDIIGELKESDLGILYYDWSSLIQNLEDYPDKSSILPSIGSYLTTAYDMDEDTTVPMRWQVLGYNASIPEYVKYKNGNERIYVRSLKNNLLAPISPDDTVYEKVGGEYKATTKKVSLVSGSFTYGNNDTWSAPKHITVGDKTYGFAGYNITLLSELALGVKHENKLYTYAQFDSNRNDGFGQNDWSTSMLRSWMNGTGDMSRLGDQIWRDFHWNYLTYGSSIYPLINRFQDTTFFENVLPTVNRTWVYNDWTSGKTLNSNQCEHVVDKFWLMGIGNMNMSESNTTSDFKDQDYDTSRFTEIFPTIDIWTSSPERARNYMNENGSNSRSPCIWWLRSANSYDSNGVGYVDYAGGVYSDRTNDNSGVLPACVIG